MAIERELSAEQYTALPDRDKELYNAEATDGKHHFIGENAGALKRAKDRVAEEKRILAEKLAGYEAKEKTLAQAREKAEHTRALKQESNEKIEELWQAKYDKDLGNVRAELERSQQVIKQQHLNSSIDKEVADISLPKYQHLVRGLYEKRVGVEMSDTGIPKLVIKDEQGNPTADSLSDLTTAIKADTRHADILKGDAPGSGATDKPNPSQVPVGDQRNVDNVTGQQRIDSLKKFNALLTATDEEVERIIGPLPPEGTVDY